MSVENGEESVAVPDIGVVDCGILHVLAPT